jgi:hypothetical protein
MNEMKLCGTHEDTKAPITSILTLIIFGVFADRIDF